MRQEQYPELSLLNGDLDRTGSKQSLTGPGWRFYNPPRASEQVFDARDLVVSQGDPTQARFNLFIRWNVDLLGMIPFVNIGDRFTPSGKSFMDEGDETGREFSPLVETDVPGITVQTKGLGKSTESICLAATGGEQFWPHGEGIAVSDPQGNAIP
jgi:hypothetical protein